MSYEKVELCKICNSGELNNFGIAQDELTTGESFALIQCQSCDTLFTSPRPTQTEISKYYKNDQYVSHKNRANSLLNLLYKVARIFTLRSKLRLIRKYHKSGTLLDYGAGAGVFAKKAISKYKTTAYEPDDTAKTQIEKEPGIRIINNLEQLPDKTQNIITLWHVLEHVHEPVTLLTQLKSKLTKDGIIILALPNYKSFDASHYKMEWAAYDVPRHLTHFCQKSIKKITKEIGMKLETVLPMKLDSYYVSLLSAKNKNIKQKLDALRVATVSNKKASSSTQYSSLIYILKK